MHVSRKKLLATIAKWVVFCLVLTVIAAHASVKFWLGPAYVETCVKKSLSHFWSGPVRVDELRFGYDGVMLIRDVVFYDLAGTEVMKASGVTLVLGNWPSLNAPAKRIEVEHLDIRLRIEDGKPAFPLRSEQNSDTEQSSLEYMSVKKATVSVEAGESRADFNGFWAEFAQTDGLYKLNIGRDVNDDSYRLALDGVINAQNQDAEINLKFAKQLARLETRTLLSAMAVPAAWGCDGKVDANLSIKGNLSQRESLWPEGTVSFENWTIFSNDTVAGRELSGELLVAKRRLDLERMAGLLCGGRLKASFYADINTSGPVAYGGDILAAEVNLAEFSEIAGATKRFTRGKGLFNLKFTGNADDINSLRTYGSAFFDDADLWQVPLIGELFKSIGILEQQVGQMSDAECVFRLSGPQMTIERGHLSNRFSAIEAEPGGQVNLRSGQVDMFVVVAPLKAVDKLAGKVPVVKWFASFKDKLVRLRLKGHWSEPAGRLIRKQPLKDIKEGTIGFVGDVAEGSGQFTEKLIKGFGLIFDPGNSRPEDK